MKKVMMLMLALLTAFAAKAQDLKLLGSNHALKRVEATQRYLLLPVQEREDMATVRVLANNQQVKQLNIRLAVDKVDYWVPLDLTPHSTLHTPLLLDIVFHGDRRFTGAMKDFVCWREMKLSDEFDTANREHFRPIYHHTPQYGWMNDPNGMFYKDGTWHLYYQWNPYGSHWENMTWGHSTSRDLIHWEAQPTAIEPDALGSIFSGSCVVSEGDIVAFYTSAGQCQTQSMAVSKDNGQTFEKYEGNPVLVSTEEDFRDPKVMWYEPTKRWIMTLAVGQEMRFYSSANLKDWTYESSFGKEYGCHDGVWECPDLMELGVRSEESGVRNEASGVKKWMLICNINPGGPFGGSATQYFIGDFDGHKFTCEHKDTRWMDYGKDHYATVTFNNAPASTPQSNGQSPSGMGANRHVAMAWMSNWQYANQVPTKQFRSANSIPRDLGLFEYNGQTYCSVTPSKEMLALRGKVTSKLPEAGEIVVDIKGSTEITLSNALGEQVVMRYDAAARTFSMDRTRTYASFSEAFPCVTTAPVYGDMRQLRIFIDRCSIETFDAEGRMAMTNLVFPTEPYNNIKVKGGKATIYEIKN
jgi:levanase/fructan beta-fructosidase